MIPPLYRGRHPHRRQHRRRQLYRAGQGLSARIGGHRHGDALADHQCHGERRAQGGARPACAISARSSSSRSRSRVRAISSRPPISRPSARSSAELTRARPGYGLLFEESGAEAGQRPAPPLDRRSARRHHQFPARHPAFRDLDRARARRRDRRRRRLRARSATRCSGPKRAPAPISTTAGCGSRRAASSARR